MAAARHATKPSRRHAAPAPRRAPAKEKAPLRVVKAPERVRSVGAMGTLFVVLVFATLFALAALHAVLVETQARIDALDHENHDLQEQLDARVAEEARLDSPDGLREAAAAAGLVEATDVPALVPVGAGLLAPPVVSDPFGPGVAE
jgi:hypothetical protein